MAFEGKVAIITGGGTGLGKAVAEALIKEGAKVVLNGRREDVLRSAANAIGQGMGTVAHVAGDISYPATADAIVDAATKRFGGVDLLFNNAGIFAPKPFLEHTEADYDRFVGTILKGKFFMAQAAAGHEAARRRSHRSDRVDVGAPGDRGNAVVGLFRGKRGRPSDGEKPCH